MTIMMSALFGVMGVCILFYGEKQISQAGKETQEIKRDTLSCSGTRAILAGIAFVSLALIATTAIQH